MFICNVRELSIFNNNFQFIPYELQLSIRVGWLQTRIGVAHMYTFFTCKHYMSCVQVFEFRAKLSDCFCAEICVNVNVKIT